MYPMYSESNSNGTCSRSRGRGADRCIHAAVDVEAYVEEYVDAAVDLYW